MSDQKNPKGRNFIDSLSEERDRLVQSNLTNLANAYMRVEAHIEDLKKAIVDEENLLERIRNAGLNPNIGLDELKKLYKEAQDTGKFL